MDGPNGPIASCLHCLLNSDIPILSDGYEPQSCNSPCDSHSFLRKKFNEDESKVCVCVMSTILNNYCKDPGVKFFIVFYPYNVLWTKMLTSYIC